MALYLVLAVSATLVILALYQLIWVPESRPRWRAYPVEVWVAVDRLANAVIPPFLSLSYADETMSARIWRAARKGRIVGRALLTPVDFMFSWQAPDPAFADIDGAPIRSHCHRAYLKEKRKFYLPVEYRDGKD
ncbi:MAG: hypothetical protein JWR07_1907 [Nevskia sp.]|nr:hypothetical protein [Nevskia sp.]